MNKKQEQCLENIRDVLRHNKFSELEVDHVEEDRVWFKSKEKIGHGPDVISSWREPVPWYSLQIIHHANGLIECDIDIANPTQGIAPALTHLCEICWPGKTDPFRIMRGLRKRGIKVRDVREQS